MYNKGVTELRFSNFVFNIFRFPKFEVFNKNFSLTEEIPLFIQSFGFPLHAWRGCRNCRNFSGTDPNWTLGFDVERFNQTNFVRRCWDSGGAKNTVAPPLSAPTQLSPFRLSRLAALWSVWGRTDELKKEKRIFFFSFFLSNESPTNPNFPLPQHCRSTKCSTIELNLALTLLLYYILYSLVERWHEKRFPFYFSLNIYFLCWY